MSNILIFSDIHGRIPLLVRLIWGFQMEREKKVDLVLVTGDLGVWPDIANLDNSTRKYCREHPEELGFQCIHPILKEFDEEQQDRLYEAEVAKANNLDPKKALQERKRQRKRDIALIDRVLSPMCSAVSRDLKCNILFVGGNHEDYDYLGFCKEHYTEDKMVPMDRKGLLLWLPPGNIYSGNGVSIAGLSGIDAKECGRNSDKYHSEAIIDDNKALEVMMSAENENIDILLTHDSLPDAVKFGKGSSLIEDIVMDVNPKYHFFGHYHSSVDPVKYNFEYINTEGIHINKLAFEKSTGNLRPQCMGHLEWNGGDNHRFEFVDDEWLKRITKNNWFKL